MTTRLLVPTIAVLLSVATRAAAHGPSAGTLHPHAHPHVDEGFGGLGAWLVAAAAIGAVGLIARSLARHR